MSAPKTKPKIFRYKHLKILGITKKYNNINFDTIVGKKYLKHLGNNTKINQVY